MRHATAVVPPAGSCNGGISRDRLIAAAQRERRPSPGAPSTGFASHQAAESTSDYTAAHGDYVDLYSPVSRLIYARHHLGPLVAQARADGPLPELGTPEWVAADAATRSAAAFVFALRYLDAAAMGSLVGARDRRVASESQREFLIAQREASHAISEAVDWTAQSRRPSHAELVRRRAVVVVPK